MHSTNTCTCFRDHITDLDNVARGKKSTHQYNLATNVDVQKTLLALGIAQKYCSQWKNSFYNRIALLRILSFCTGPLILNVGIAKSVK